MRRLLLVWSILIGPAFAALGAQSARTVLRGVVLDSAANPLAGVALWLLPLGAVARTDSVGRFRFDLEAGGAFRIVSRQIGFVADTFAVTVRDGQDRQVALQLTRVRSLARVEVRAFAGVMPRLVDRASKGISTIMLQEEIKAYRIYELNDLLRFVPRFSAPGRGTVVFIDGRPSRGPEDHPNPSDIAAIEMTYGMMGWDEPDLWPPFWLNRSSSVSIIMVWTYGYVADAEQRRRAKGPP